MSTHIQPPNSRPMFRREHCPGCNYDLRGTTGEVCSECGLPRTIEIPIHDGHQFHQACALLQQHGLLIKAIAPVHGFGAAASYAGTYSSPGFLWVDRRRVDEVAPRLDELGILHQIGVRPIVDIAEPVCPGCERDLDADGPDVCPHCGTAFTWIDVDHASHPGDNLSTSLPIDRSSESIPSSESAYEDHHSIASIHVLIGAAVGFCVFAAGTALALLLVDRNSLGIVVLAAMIGVAVTLMCVRTLHRSAMTESKRQSLADWSDRESPSQREDSIQSPDAR